MQKEFNPRRDVIKDLIPAGLTLTMSAEKIGKSSMFRQVGYSVATGEKCFGDTFSPAVTGHVLYLSFEDDDQSIQESMEMFCQNSIPPNYQFQYQWKRIGKGCIRALESYMRDFPNTKLIIIDTLAYIRSKDNGKTTFGRYHEDVDDMNKLKRFCSKHDLSIMVSTHTKKGKEDDWTRNVHGGVLLYADKLTDSMKAAITENNRRRRIQQQYNKDNNIKPTTIRKEVRSIVEHLMQVTPKEEEKIDVPEGLTSEDLLYVIDDLKGKMAEAAGTLDFEKAAIYRDKIKELEKMVN